MQFEMTRLESESLEEYVWRLGSAKSDVSNPFNPTWQDIAKVINEETGFAYDESHWRKMFRRMQKSMGVPDVRDSSPTEISPEARSALQAFEVEHQKLRDERTAYRADLRREARTLDLMDKLCEAVKNVPAFEAPVVQPSPLANNGRAIYAMLSDIHYGVTFSNAVGVYSSEIAQQRVFEYAQRIAAIRNETGASECYVSLMGDLISGQIHPSIRVENRENIVSQIVGVSELIADFLYLLAHCFDKVYVNAVDGNHSRLEGDLKKDIHTERLDRIIPWFCKARLNNVPNVEFSDNILDSSIGVFEIYNKTYVSVHGDFDSNKNTVHNIQELIGKPIDYFLSAHMHVPNMRFERVGLIQNGAVVSCGDDFTVRNRLFGKPYQVCMLVSENGVEAVYPVKL